MEKKRNLWAHAIGLLTRSLFLLLILVVLDGQKHDYYGGRKFDTFDDATEACCEIKCTSPSQQCVVYRIDILNFHPRKYTGPELLQLCFCRSKNGTQVTTPASKNNQSK